MDTITFPSPSALFVKSPVPEKVSIAPVPIKPVHSTPKTPIQRNGGPTAKRPAPAAGSKHGVTKPKQSKSRNGCVTCKAKRLKCDETKPTCQQCLKRNVTCGGYKKDFKWRSFEETTFVSKPGAKPKKASPPPSQQQEHQQVQSKSTSPSVEVGGSQIKEEDNRTSSTSPTQLQQTLHESPDSQEEIPFDESLEEDDDPTVIPESYPPPPFSHDLSLEVDMTFPTTGLTPDPPLPDLDDPNNVQMFMSGSSPPENVLLPPISSGQVHPSLEADPTLANTAYRPTGWTPPADNMLMDEDIEEIPRFMPGVDDSMPPFNDIGLPPMWASEEGSGMPTGGENDTDSEDSSLLVRPKLHPGSMEMLAFQFHERTIGILSVKNGASENPWRTLIWPLAQESSALYHAIISLTAFHSSRESAVLRVDGIHHMMKSIKHLNAGLTQMKPEVSLATTLVLAFAESWDQHTTTGIQHLRGAKLLVKNALARHHAEGIYNPRDTSRLRFLTNAWIYMDVIARLTAVSDDDHSDLENIMLSMNNPQETMEIDPLLGCAATLFPLIGNVASLIGKVRRSKVNSLDIISRASELKSLLEQWRAPSPYLFETPEDPTSEIQHSLQTAEAYRWATILYLHQAVPEIPSDSSADLAARVLTLLATVPISSRATIIHIYPLLAAGCEATSPEDRKFVEDRWQAITRRLRIGNADKCIIVVKEVWNRRDQYKAQQAERMKQRDQDRFIIPLPSPAESSGNKRPAFSSDDVMDANPYFMSTVNSGGYDRSEPSKRRATHGSEPRPIPISTPSLAHRLSMSCEPASILPGAMRKRPSDAQPDDRDIEYTVRGRLHWIGVMTEWGWEILLG